MHAIYPTSNRQYKYNGHFGLKLPTSNLVSWFAALTRHFGFENPTRNRQYKTKKKIVQTCATCHFGLKHPTRNLVSWFATVTHHFGFKTRPNIGNTISKKKIQLQKLNLQLHRLLEWLLRGMLDRDAQKLQVKKGTPRPKTEIDFRLF